MSEENEKYPQIVLGTDGSYQIFISKGVEVRFESEEDINEFVKDKNFIIKGTVERRLEEKYKQRLNEYWEVLSKN